MSQTILGDFGEWAAGVVGEGPGRLSFRQPRFRAQSLEGWRRQARQRLRELLLMPEGGAAPRATLQHQFEFDGLHVEHLQWRSSGLTVG